MVVVEVDDQAAKQGVKAIPYKKGGLNYNLSDNGAGQAIRHISPHLNEIMPPLFFECG